MAAQTQPVPADSAKAQFEAAYEEQQRLRATLSPEAYEARRQQAIRELIETTERSTAYAESQGMTDELLEQLLADEP